MTDEAYRNLKIHVITLEQLQSFSDERLAHNNFMATSDCIGFGDAWPHIVRVSSKGATFDMYAVSSHGNRETRKIEVATYCTRDLGYQLRVYAEETVSK